ncbi:MAG: 16S rRNA (cytosine(1402)-N(4))-methyltransferase RsmH [Candidatus Izemoplasmatales bacterium]|nr:16S rRNA (cytosine(1402)-N(4))-methyltransferase RsmH [bacterium]MDZ4195679.1 16S rRNA (cytosine(1402)-N(4))-methyltransferase RsmH [Candidatus Izemoplasmatales bacterium]
MKHDSVLLIEAIEGLNIKPDGIYVDCTLGGGGHAEAILKQLTTGHLFAFDQDEFAHSFASNRLKEYSNITYIKANFRQLAQELANRSITQVDGILYDLGVSSFQFDIPQRGFSYQHDSPLDMRMNQQASLTAFEIVNHSSKEALLEILYRYGEEDQAKWIVNAIIKQRAIQPIHTTFELVEVIKSALPIKILRQKGHPAKQTFQALRIAVNDELKAFEDSLLQAITCLKQGGRVVVITFHSLEDRICKTVFRDQSTIFIPKGLAYIPTEVPPLKLVHSKVIYPSSEELLLNNRAHSAKMRIAEKNSA